MVADLRTGSPPPHPTRTNEMDDWNDDFVGLMVKLTNYIQNVRIEAYNKGVDDERMRKAHEDLFEIKDQ